jgi:hypothetical protein
MQFTLLLASLQSFDAGLHGSVPMNSLKFAQAKYVLSRFDLTLSNVLN